jgi:tRNA-dihydrouridine synthase
MAQQRAAPLPCPHTHPTHPTHPTPLHTQTPAQICGGYSDTVARAAQLLDEQIDCTFVDINMGCPIDLVCDKGGGSALMTK